MIILDDDLSGKQSPRPQASEEPVPHTILLRDAMDTDLELDGWNSPATVGPSREDPAPLPPSYEASVRVGQDGRPKWKSRRRKFCLIPAAIIFIYIVVSISILARRAVRRRRHPHFPPFHDPWFRMLNPVEIPHPATSTIDQFTLQSPENDESDVGMECREWGNVIDVGNFSASESAIFSFKPKEEIIFRPSLPPPHKPHHKPHGKHGSHALAAGSLLVTLNKNPSEREATLVVRPVFIDPSSSTTARVCADRTDNTVTFDHSVMGEGPGFAPMVLLDMILMLPVSNETKNWNFTSHLGRFDHIFENLAERRLFERVEIIAPFSAIDSKGLAAKKISFESGMRAIRGRFRVSDSISLRTHLAPVDVSVDLVSADGRPVSFALETVNSPINATFNLSRYNQERDLSVSKFSGTVKSANGPLDLSILFREDPDCAELDLKTETSFKPAHLYLDSRYQGNFTVQTKSALAQFNGQRSDDALRFTTFEDEQSDARSSGWTGFSDKYLENSQVIVSNQFGPALLSFTGLPRHQLPLSKCPHSVI